MSKITDETGRLYIERVRLDAQRYTRELLQENDNLRSLVVSLEAEKRRLGEQLQAIRDEAERFAREQQDLHQRLTEMQTESSRFAEQFVQVERQNSNLANLYVASYQFAGTLDRDRVLQVIQEILANLVGSEEIAVFELDDTGASLRLVASHGIESAAFARVALGQGVIGAVAASGDGWIAGDAAPAEGTEALLTACVPLKLEDRVTGAIAIFRLLPQKRGIEPVDRELFDLLATHAAMALYCTALHQRQAR
jgi:regulator of replication initiation timing